MTFQVVWRVAESCDRAATTSRAILRHTVAISRSRFRTPASFVYEWMISRSVSSPMSSVTSAMPLSRICLGTRYFSAIEIFSNSVYPGNWMISMRSCSGSGMPCM